MRKNFSCPLRIKENYDFFICLSKGVGQIMLQENAITGLLFLLGIFLTSWVMGLAALLAAAVGTLTAFVLKFDKERTKQGLYGFSAALVGVGLTLYFQPLVWVWIAIVLGSIAATILQNYFFNKKIPVFTLPFVLVTWLFIYIFRNLYVIEATEIFLAPLVKMQDFTFAFRGIGQVIFQGSLFAGIIFFIGIFIHSPAAALYGLSAAVVAGALSAWAGAPSEAIAMGLFSYNAVLSAIVFAGNKRSDGVCALIAVVLSVIISMLMYQYDLVQLTFPFVLATGLTLILKKLATALKF